MAISNIVVPGVAISSVDMIPIRAYAKAQKGKASGSLHGTQYLHLVVWYACQQHVCIQEAPTTVKSKFPKLQDSEGMQKLFHPKQICKRQAALLEHTSML